MDTIKKEHNILALFKKDETESNFSKELLGLGYDNITFATPESLSSSDNQRTYDVVLSGTKPNFEYTDSLITKLFSLVKPGGLFLIRHLTKDDVQKLEFVLKTNGFSNVSTQKQESNGTTICEIKGFKPTYEIGSATKLNLKKAPAPAAVWKLDADDDFETIDPDNLLDDEDFKKPEQDSLRVCGTTGKRKACKDCSCGLAEELDAEATARKPVNSAEAKSSCGSCYLGDAFRCATCPYLGMPAFKPGEKVQLSEGLLKADS